MNSNVSHFSNQTGNLLSPIDSLDNGSNYTLRYDRKQWQEMRKELILIFRFFCLDKNVIVNLLKGPDGSIAKEGSVKFSEASVHTILTQALSTVQDWLRELHVHHSEVLDHRKTIAKL
jgi:hypothetical protein